MNLDALYYGNTLRAWLIALAVGVGVYAFLFLIRPLLLGRLAAVAKRTETELDDAFVALVERTRWFFFAAIAVSVALAWVEVPAAAPFVRRVMLVVVLLQAGLWVGVLVEFFANRTLRRRREADDRFGVATVRALSVAAKFFAWVVIGLLALSWVFQKPITPLITGLGIGGIALALAVQQILGDLLAAVAIVFDRPFDVGDTIGVDTTIGTVERIGLKTTRIRSVNGEQIVFSNADLLKSRVHNYARIFERRVMLVFEVNAATPTDALARIPGIVEEIVRSQSPTRFARCHLTQITEGIRRFECVYYVLDADHTRMMDVQQAVNLEVLKRLGAEEITLARPMRLVERGVN